MFAASQLGERVGDQHEGGNENEAGLSGAGEHEQEHKETGLQILPRRRIRAQSKHTIRPEMAHPIRESHKNPQCKTRKTLHAHEQVPARAIPALRLGHALDPARLDADLALERSAEREAAAPERARVDGRVVEDLQGVCNDRKSS
jgi:hypothetical protein